MKINSQAKKRRGPVSSVSDWQVGQVVLWAHALGSVKAALDKFGIDRQAFYHAQRRCQSFGIVYAVQPVSPRGDSVTLSLVTL